MARPTDADVPRAKIVSVRFTATELAQMQAKRKSRGISSDSVYLRHLVKQDKSGADDE